MNYIVSKKDSLQPIFEFMCKNPELQQQIVVLNDFAGLANFICTPSTTTKTTPALNIPKIFDDKLTIYQATNEGLDNTYRTLHQTRNQINTTFKTINIPSLLEAIQTYDELKNTKKVPITLNTEYNLIEFLNYVKYAKLQREIYEFKGVDGKPEGIYVDTTDGTYTNKIIEASKIKTTTTYPSLHENKVTDNLLINLEKYLSYLRETKGGSVRVYLRFRRNSGGNSYGCLEDRDTRQPLFNPNNFYGIFGGLNNIYDNNTFYSKLTSGDTTLSIEPLNIVDDILKNDTDTLIMTYGYSGTGKTYTLFGNKETGQVGLVQNVTNGILINTDFKPSIEIYKAFILHKGNVSKQNESNSNNFMNDLKKGIIKELNTKQGLDHILNENRNFSFWTPNNPESSRGHLFIIFKVKFKTKDGNSKEGFFTVIDLAGLEDVKYIFKYISNYNNTKLNDFLTQKTTNLNTNTANIYIKPITKDNTDIVTSKPDFKKTFFDLQTLITKDNVYSINDMNLNNSLNRIELSKQAKGNTDQNIKNKYRRIKYLYDRIEEGVFINDSLQKLADYLKPDPPAMQFKVPPKEPDTDIRNILTQIRNHFLTQEQVTQDIANNKINKKTRFVMIFTFKQERIEDNCGYYKASIDFASQISSKKAPTKGGRGIRKRISKKAEEKRPKTKRTSKVRG
jgi:hypothetical protein